MTIHDFLRYEIYSSWWAGLISNPTLRDWASTYFAWKTKRKWRRYVHCCKAKVRLAEKGIKFE